MSVLERIKNHYEQKKEVKKIEVCMSNIVRELKLYNSYDLYPNVIKVKFTSYGYKIYFSISLICSYSRLKENKEYIKDCFGAYSISLENDRGHITLTIYNKPLENKEYKKILMSPYNLLVGYNYEKELFTNMRIAPHLLITGLSGQGKTKQAKVITANLLGSAEVYLLNFFQEDLKEFTGLKAINGMQEIYFFLNTLKAEKFTANKTPIYIIIDELATVSEDKQILKILKEILTTGRHYNIFIIGIIQVARSEDFKLKTFFTSRISFKQIDKANYITALGSSEGIEELKQREFYIKGSEGLEKGKTYNI